MASVRLAKIKSVIKGHHVYRSCSEAGDTVTCTLGPENVHSRNAIKVLAQEEIVGHVPELLAKVLAPEFAQTIQSMEGEVTEPPRDAPEGKWVLGGGIEIPCTYKIYGMKEKRKKLRKKIRDAMFK